MQAQGKPRAEPRRYSERGEVRHLVPADGGRHVEPVHEVELHDAALRHPRAAEVGRPVHQGLGLYRCDGEEQHSHGANDACKHVDPSLT